MGKVKPSLRAKAHHHLISMDGTTIAEIVAYDTHSIHIVSLYDDDIHTTVTNTPSIVDNYISEILFIHRHRLHHLVVGLDIEWRPTFGRQNAPSPVATLQLCVGRKCLIFQLLWANYIPESLVEFLENPDYQFVGAGISQDADKLWSDHGLTVGNPVDLKDLAEESGMYGLRNAGLKTLAWEVLEMEIEKPRRITLSRWDNQWLSDDQIKYACVDAFVSFEIGRTLISQV